MKKVITLFSLLLMAAVQTWAVPATAIAQITDAATQETYNLYSADDLKNAFEKKGEFDIKLISDCEYDGSFSTVSESDITLDLNGHNLTLKSLYIYGSMTINDSKNGGVSGSINLTSESIDFRGTSLIINGGNITGSYSTIVTYDGPVTINGGSFSLNPEGHCLLVASGGTITLNGGTFTSEADVDYIFTINGGSVTLGNNCVYRAEGHNDLRWSLAGLDYAGEVVSGVVFEPSMTREAVIAAVKEVADNLVCYDLMSKDDDYVSLTSYLNGRYERTIEEELARYTKFDEVGESVFTFSGIEDYSDATIAVVKGAVEKYTMDDLMFEYRPTPIDESELVALIGDNVYYNDAMGLRLCVDNDKVMVMGIPICQMGHLTMSDGNYICELSGYTTFVFVVEDSEIARVNMSSYEGETTFFKEVIQDGPLAGLLSVPQAGKLDIQAYFTASIGRPYQYMLVKGAYYSLEALKEDINKSIYVYESGKLTVESAPQSISIVKDDEELEDGEDYTLVVYYTNIYDEINELATIPFTVGVGEKESDDIMTISAGKLNITYSFSVSDEKFEEGMNYMYMLIEGEYYSMEQAQNSRKNPIYASFGSKQLITPDDEITMTSNPEEISLVSDDVELKDGKVYTLIVYNVFTSEGLECYVMAHYKAVDNSTPTAIESLDANKSQKAVKTIENGKVVIIRGDKKYDLSGREL